MSYESVDIFVEDTTPSKNPIAGVVVKILSADGTTQYGLATSDTDGHVGFLLPTEASPFQARFFKFSVTFPNPLTLVIYPTPLLPGQTNTFDVPGTLVAPPVPTDSRLCTAYGFFRDVSGAPAPNTEIFFIAKFDPLWVDGAGVLRERISVRTDETGYVQTNLFRNAHYNCTIAGEDDITRHIEVPDLPNCNIVDLIFPIAATVAYDPPGPYTLHVGDTLVVTPTIYASSGKNLGMANGDVTYTSDTPAVLGLQFTPNCTITFKAVSPGTANIVVERTNKSIVHIPDTGIAGSPQLVTVVP